MTKRGNMKIRRSPVSLTIGVIAFVVGWSLVLQSLQAAGGNNKERAWLGISVGKIGRHGERLFLPPLKGVLVTDVVDDSPAEMVGLEAGDIIGTFDGVRIKSPRDFYRMMRRKNPGDAVLLQVFGDGKKRKLKVPLQVYKGEGDLAVDFRADTEDGALITEVKGGRTEQPADLKPEDLLTKIEDDKIGSSDELGDILLDREPRGENAVSIIHSRKHKKINSGHGSELYDELMSGSYPSNVRQVAHQMVLSIGASGTLYWIIALSAYVFLVFFTLFPFFKTNCTLTSSTSGQNLIEKPALFAICTSLSIFFFRWPVLSLTEMNPDESRFVAGAMTLLHDPVFWRSVDGLSSGPFAYYVALLPKLFGLTIDYGSIKLVGLGLMISTALLLYGTLKNAFNDSIARIAILPMTTCISLFTFFDYVSYNGEHMTVCLLTASMYIVSEIAVASASKLNRLSLTLGFVLGCVPYTKLQGTPVAAAIALAGYIIIYVRTKEECLKVSRPIIRLTIGGLIAPVFILAYLFYFDIFDHFWQSYILNNLEYATALKISFLDKLSKWWFFFKPHQTRAFFLSLTLIPLIGFISMFIHRKYVLFRHYGIILLALLLMFSSIYSVIQIGIAAAHHYLFLIVPFTFLGGCFLGVAHETVCQLNERTVEKMRRISHRMGLVFIFVGILCNEWVLAKAFSLDGVLEMATRLQVWLSQITLIGAGLILLRYVKVWDKSRNRIPNVMLVVLFFLTTVAYPLTSRVMGGYEIFEEASNTDRVVKSNVARKILDYASPGEKLIVWGWMAGYYVQTGLIQGTREANTSRQIWGQDYYITRFIDDMVASEAPVLIDAVGEGQFAYEDRKSWAHGIYPEVKSQVDKLYKLVDDIDGVRIYVSKERLADLSQG